jgi:hypothetical protein
MRRIKTRLISFVERERMFNEMSKLSDRDLNDIGLTRSDLMYKLYNKH